MRNHPLIDMRGKVEAFDFLPLVRSYVDLHAIYLLDLPYTRGRIRLTHTQNGQYVIFGQPAFGYMPEFDSGVDEQLGLIIPGPVIRVRITKDCFVPVVLPQDIQYKAAQGTWGLQFIIMNGNPSAISVRVWDGVVNILRNAQYEAITQARIQEQVRA